MEATISGRNNHSDSAAESDDDDNAIMRMIVDVILMTAYVRIV